MENHDPLYPEPPYSDPPGPDPLRDGKNPDRAAGLVTFHQLRRKWEESQETVDESDGEDASPHEMPDSTPPSAAPPRVAGTNRLMLRVLWTIAGVLCFVVLLTLLLRT